MMLLQPTEYGPPPTRIPDQARIVRDFGRPVAGHRGEPVAFVTSFIDGIMPQDALLRAMRAGRLAGRVASGRIDPRDVTTLG